MSAHSDTPMVSVDLEEVLAGTHGRMLEIYNERNGTTYSLEDISYWDWVAEEIDFDEFMTIIANTWADGPLSIQPREGNLNRTLGKLSRATLYDVVTARNGDYYDESRSTTFDSTHAGMEYWLDHYGITSYRMFLSNDPSISKATLGYTYFLDDKPSLAYELEDWQHLFLLERPWNENVRSHANVTPVSTVREGVTDILARL